MGRYSDILIVSDWDRTVTAPDRSIPSANTEAVLRFMEEGGLLSIATGHTRLSHGSRWDRLPTNAPHIVFNGAEIYDYRRGELLWVGDLGPEAEADMRCCMERFPGLHYEVQCSDASYVYGEDGGLSEILASMGVPIRYAPLEAVPRPWIQLAVASPLDYAGAASPEEEALFQAVADFFNLERQGYAASRSLPILVEVQAAGCHKGAAARRLADMLGRKTLVCCGDAPNDLSMLQEADLAFVASDGDPVMLNMGFTAAAPCCAGTLADVISRL